MPGRPACERRGRSANRVSLPHRAKARRRVRSPSALRNAVTSEDARAEGTL
jgi:hypothetical protein